MFCLVLVEASTLQIPYLPDEPPPDGLVAEPGHAVVVGAEVVEVGGLLGDPLASHHWA